MVGVNLESFASEKPHLPLGLPRRPRRRLVPLEGLTAVILRPVKGKIKQARLSPPMFFACKLENRRFSVCFASAHPDLFDSLVPLEGLPMVIRFGRELQMKNAAIPGGICLLRSENA